MESIFFEISAIIIVSTAFALLAKLLKQPIILAFMLAGIVLGPLGLNWLHSHELIDVLATFGIAFVLYLIGIELDLKKFKSLDKVTLFSGVGQMLFTSLAGFIVAWSLGFSINESWFIAIALAFSSTIIIVKLLGEKRQLDSLYGRIAIAILIVQDILAVLALLIIESFDVGASITDIPWMAIGFMLVKAVAVIAIAMILAKYVFKRIFAFIAHSQELLFLWSIAWCLLFAALSITLDFSIAVGVFFAGIAISSLDYNFEISARIRSLRDFFIVIFFSFIGSQLVLALEPKYLIASIILSLFVLIGNPLIVYVILTLGGNRRRTALFTGLAIGQISEFSFIIISAGYMQEQLSHELVSMVAIIGLITMVVSTYFITYNEKIYQFLKPLLYKIPLPPKEKERGDLLPDKELKNHIILIGYHITINKILKDLKALKKDIVVLDYDPENSDIIKNNGMYYIYGDMRDEDILQRAQISHASMIISIVPYPEPTMSLLQYIKNRHIKAKVIVRAQYISDVEKYYRFGATFVLHPESISLDYLKNVLKKEELAQASTLHKKEVLKLLRDIGKEI